MWLRDDIDSSVYLPLEDGTFGLDRLSSPFVTLSVEGSEIQQTPARNNNLPPSRPVSLTSTQSGSRTTTPLRHFVTASKRRPPASYTLRIVKARLNKKRKGKPDSQVECQAYVEIVEDTANVDYITLNFGDLATYWLAVMGYHWKILQQHGVRD